MRLRCRLGLHRWVAFRTVTGDYGRTVDSRCSGCGRERTNVYLWQGWIE